MGQATGFTPIAMVEVPIKLLAIFVLSFSQDLYLASMMLLPLSQIM